MRREILPILVVKCLQSINGKGIKLEKLNLGEVKKKIMINLL